MNRRSFLSLLCSLPLVGWLVPASAGIVRQVRPIWQPPRLSEPFFWCAWGGSDWSGGWKQRTFALAREVAKGEGLPKYRFTITPKAPHDWPEGQWSERPRDWVHADMQSDYLFVLLRPDGSEATEAEWEAYMDRLRRGEMV